jgi:hypothetical protein
MYYKQQQQQIKLDCRKEKLTQPWETKIHKTKKSSNSDDVVMITARKQNLDGKMANNLNVKSGSSLARESEERKERERERERERK